MKVEIGYQGPPEAHGVWTSAFYHLFPGALTTMAYLAFAWLIRSSALPPLAAMLMATLCVLVPCEGLLIKRQSRKLVGRLMLKPLGKTRAWPLYLILCLAAALLLPGIAFIAEPSIRSHFFRWVPAWAQLYDLHAISRLPKSTRISLVITAILIVGVIGPITEELYFRAFLLRRIAHWGWVAAVWNAALFSLYHFWQFWTVLTVFCSFLVPCLVVLKTRNAVFSVCSHVLTNVIRLAILLIPLI